MKASTEIRQRAIALLEKLPEAMLDEAVQLLESLRVKADLVREVEVSKPEESALLEIIHRHLPADERRHLNYLRDRDEMGEITDLEHSQLLAYAERLEYLSVERLRALLELAKLRNVNLDTLLSQLKSEEGTDNAF
jgi:hypothetical protein